MIKKSTAKERGNHWNLELNDDGTWPDAKVQIALLADIRDSLVEIRDDHRMLLAIFRCANTQAGFRALRSLARSERQRIEAAKKRRRK